MIKIHNNHGFTLPEILLTVAILSYSLSAILATFINSIALNEMSRNLSIATSHAEFVLEEIRNTTFSSISTNITNGSWNWDTAEVGTNGLTALNSEAIAATVSGTTLLDVTVTVSWNDAQSRARTRSLRTLISS